MPRTILTVGSLISLAIGFVVLLAAIAQPPIQCGKFSPTWSAFDKPSATHTYLDVRNGTIHFCHYTVLPLPSRLHRIVLPGVSIYWGKKGGWYLDACLANYSVVALVSALPCCWVLRVRLNRQQLQNRLSLVCAFCGYDLRATPERCPECGVTVELSIARSGDLKF